MQKAQKLLVKFVTSTN